MALHNFSFNRAKYLNLFGSNIEPKLSFYYSIVLHIYGDELREEHQIQKESELIPLVLQKLEQEFELPTQNGQYLSLVQDSEVDFLVSGGQYTPQQFAQRQKAVKKIYDFFKTSEDKKGRSSEALKEDFLAGKIDVKNPDWKRAISLTIAEDRRVARQELQNRLLDAGKLKRNYSSEDLNPDLTSIRWSKSNYVSHSLQITSDEDRERNDGDILDQLYNSIMTLKELYFILANCEKHSFCVNVLLYDNQKVYPSALAIGEQTNNSKNRRQHSVTLFKISVKNEDIHDAMHANDTDLENLFNSNRVNVNETKEALQKMKSDCESVEARRVRARAKRLFGQELPFRGSLKEVAVAQHERLLAEAENTCTIFYSIKNLNLFLREIYTPGEEGKQGSHRQAHYCSRCLKVFFRNCQALVDHEAVCRGRGQSGM